MDAHPSFGAWLKRRRKALDLTQSDLANLVGCAAVTIRKVEADEMRPSRQMAELLARHLEIDTDEHAMFVQFARLGLDKPPALPVPTLPQQAATVKARQTRPFSAAMNSSTLPQPATPFVGRTVELADIKVILDDPACRLVTLTGPGGIGKTRLALAVAAARTTRYPHGVWFVSLASVTSADSVLSAILDALKLSSLGFGEPRLVLENYLRDRKALLVLDNFEHVLEAADLVVDMLTAAQGLQVLVTSRERLRLRAERVYEVGGLPFPVDITDADTSMCDAMRMFAAYMHHSHPQYVLDAAETEAAAQICRLTAGMPLAIELAAAWVPTLSVATIAGELAASLDFLKTTLRDVPERHRSARAMFEHSWRLLTGEEQALFAQLSVFRGGFTFRAAQHVAGATAALLARLVDKSLLTAERDGRYGIHELLRQFAIEKLQALPGAEDATRTRHSTFFLEWIHHNQLEVKGPRQLQVLDEIERDFENLRTACLWALECKHWQQLRTSVRTISFYMTVRSRQHEGVALLQQIVDTVGAAQSMGETSVHAQGLATYALIAQSWYFARLGQTDRRIECLERTRASVEQYGTPYEIALHCHLYATTRTNEAEARALFERSLAFFRSSGETWDVAFVINGRGNFAFARGENLIARDLYAEALTLWQSRGELQGTANGLLNLGRVAYALGDYEQCSRLLEESLSLQQAVGSKIRTAECLEALGKNESAQGSHSRAEACFSQQAAVLRDLGNRELLSLSLSQLGGAVLAQGRTDDAVVLLAAALATAEACGDTPAIALAHKEHGYLALQRGDDEVAAQHWRLALTLASGTPDRQHLLVMLDALLGLTMLMARTGDTERAVETASLVQQAARIDRYTQTRAETMLAELAGRLPQDRLTRGVEHGKALEFGATVTALLA